MRLLSGGIACIAALLVVAGTAGAATRYAAPAGSGPEPCEKAAPCALKEAIVNAKANDEVIVEPGDYAVSASILTPAAATGLEIRGEPGAAAPVLTSTFSGPIDMLRAGAAGVRFAYLVLHATSSYSAGVACEEDGVVERVRSTASGNFVPGIRQIGNCLVRDSVAVASGQEAIGISSYSVSTAEAEVVNVTAIASGPKSVGVKSIYAGIATGVHTLDVRNTIARGESDDLYAAYFSGGPGNITVSNSNFLTTHAQAPATIVPGPANQAAPPLFVNAAGGDFREAAGSPTIDAGALDPEAGPLDLEGNPRVVNGAIDIGAYEFLPQPATKAETGTAAAGRIESLILSPPAFRAAKGGEAIASFKDKVVRAPGTTVAYSLSAAAPVTFTVDRKVTGRKVGKRCVKQTEANKGKKRCQQFKPVRGSFAATGKSGANTFKFSGRIGGKGLAPGAYRLVGSAGGATRSAAFRIVR